MYAIRSYYVLNISDRASAGVYADIPGQACVALLREWLATPFEVDYKVVPDEQGRPQPPHMGVRAGSLLRADGGYLILEAKDA